jgi:hypothetical protein
MLKQIILRIGPYIIVCMKPPKVNSAPALVSIHISVTNPSPNIFLFQPWAKSTSNTTVINDEYKEDIKVGPMMKKVCGKVV